jgi:hypothetical protein
MQLRTGVGDPGGKTALIERVQRRKILQTKRAQLYRLAPAEAPGRAASCGGCTTTPL